MAAAVMAPFDQMLADLRPGLCAVETVCSSTDSVDVLTVDVTAG
jgi:hypothetical protein